MSYIITSPYFLLLGSFLLFVWGFTCLRGSILVRSELLSQWEQGSKEVLTWEHGRGVLANMIRARATSRFVGLYLITAPMLFVGPILFVLCLLFIC